MPSNLAAVWAIVRRDLTIMASYRLSLFGTLAGLFFNLTLFYYLSRLVRVAQFQSADDYYAFVVIGLMIQQVLQSTLGLAGALRNELVAGTFERMLLSPFGALPSILSMMVFPFLFSILTSAVSLVFAAAVFGLPLQWDTAILALPVGMLGVVSFTAFSLLFLAATLVFKQVIGGTGWIVAGISLIAGLYFPISLLPGWAQWLSDVQPFTPAVDLMRHLLVGTELRDTVVHDVVKMAGFAVVLLPTAIGMVSLGLSAARRRGTIIEY